MQKKRRTLKRLRELQLVRILKRQKWLLSGLCVSLVVQSAVSMIQPWPLKIIFDHIILDKPFSQEFRQSLSWGWETFSEHVLVIMVAALIVVALLAGISLYVQNLALTKLSQSVVQQLRVRLFSHLLSLPLGYVRKVGRGEIIERITTDTDDSQKLVEALSILLCRSFPTSIGIAIIMFYVDIYLALATITIAPFLVWCTYFFGTRVKIATRKKRRHETAVTSVAEVATTTYKWLKLLGLEEKEIEKFEEKSKLSLGAGLEAGNWQGFYIATTNVALAVGTAILIFLGVHAIQSGRITAGDLLVFMSYLQSLYKPIREFTKYHVKITKAVACTERIEELMAISSCELGICEQPDAKDLHAFTRSVVFDDVTFRYEDGPVILQNVSFQVKKGEKVAFVGGSGCGKSTLLNLMPRFFDPTGGHITIDGHEIKALTLDSLRRNISIVTQDLVLFHSTIRENIALGRAEDDLGEEDIIAAARQANAHEFITELPEGYDTLLSSGSKALSGGQAKRILIARAFLRNAPIVLLDEPTSGLDPASETLVMDAFDRLSSNKTLIVASHRLPVIANADKIFVLQEGRITEAGSHDELLAQEGLYYRFWSEQVKLTSVEIN